MNFNQQLYKQFIDRKRSRQPYTQSHPTTIRRRQIMRLFLQLSDDELITLQSSIPLLKRISIIKTIQSVDNIAEIMTRKNKSHQGWSGNQQQLLQCRLIYFLWAVIEQQAIEMRQFKEVIFILISDEDKNKLELIKNLYGQKEGIEQLIQCWDRLSEDRKDTGHQNSKQQISDISIIKSKNEGNFESNKQNISYFQEQDLSNSHRLKPNTNKNSEYHTNPLQKSFQKRDSKAKLNRSGSSGKMYGRKSLTSTVNSTNSGARGINMFVSNQNLTLQQQQNLVSRLYKFDKYKEREQLKKRLEQQRQKAQLNQCSFKPNLEDRTRAMSRSKISCKQVKGYDKAIGRMKSGYKKNKEMKQNLEYRIWAQPNISNKNNHQYSAPKFLTRVRAPEVELFQIVFTIGRHNIRVKIRESDKISEIVNNIGQIYALKEQNKSYIRSIIQEQLNNFYENKCKLQAKDQQIIQNA